MDKTTAACKIGEITAHTDSIAGLGCLDDGGILSWDSVGHVAISHTRRAGGYSSRRLDGKHFWKVQDAVQVAASRVASWSSTELILWDTENNILLVRSIVHEAPIRGIAKLGNNYFATWAGDEVIKVWDTASGVLVRKVSGHTNAVTSLQVRKDDFITTSDDGTLRVWTLAGESCERVLRPTNGAGLDGASPCIDGIVVAWSGRHICVCDLAADTVRVVDAGTDKGYGYDSSKGHGWKIRGACTVSDNRWILTWSESNEESLKLWDAQTLELVECFWLDNDDRALDVFSVSESGVSLGEYWSLPDAPSISFWVRGKNAIYRFEIPKSPELGSVPECLHSGHSSSTFLYRHNKRGVINGAAILASGAIVSHSVTEAAFWMPAEDIIWTADNFVTDTSGDINALVLLNDDRCAVAAGNLISVWGFGTR